MSSKILSKNNRGMRTNIADNIPNSYTVLYIEASKHTTNKKDSMTPTDLNEDN